MTFSFSSFTHFTLLSFLVCIITTSHAQASTRTRTSTNAVSPTPTKPPTLKQTFAMPGAAFIGDLTPRTVKIAGDAMFVSFSQDFANVQSPLGTTSTCCPSLELWEVGATAKTATIANGLPYATCGKPLEYDSATPMNTNYWGGLRAGSSSCSSIFGWTIPATTTSGNYYIKVAAGVITPSGQPSGVFTVSSPYLKPAQPLSAGLTPDNLADAAAVAISGVGKNYGLVATLPPAVSFTSLTTNCVSAFERTSPNVILACPINSIIVNFSWADYGTFTGGCHASGAAPPKSRVSCGHTCASTTTTLAAVTKLCVGSSSCTIPNGHFKTAPSLNSVFTDPCVGTLKQFIGFYTCGVKVIVTVPVPPSEDSPEAYATIFGGEKASISWASNDISPGPFAGTVTVELISASSSQALTSTPLEVNLLGQPAPAAGLDSTWAANVTLPNIITILSNGWSFAATDYCRFRVHASDPAAPSSLTGLTPTFLCGPVPAVYVALPVVSVGSTPAAASPGNAFNITWGYPVGMRANIMGRPTLTLYALIVPTVNGIKGTAVRVPWGVVMPVSAFGPIRTDYSRAGPTITAASWIVPTRSRLNSGCPALTAADRAAWPIGSSTDINTELAALCALTSTSSSWALGVAMERRPATTGFTPSFTIRGVLLTPSPRGAVLNGGSTLTLTWDNAGIGAMRATATLCGGVVTLLSPQTLPGANPTSLSIVLPATRAADCACDPSGAPSVGLVTLSSLTDATITVTVPFTIIWPFSATASATLSSVSGTLTPGAALDFSWAACANVTGYAITLDCGPAMATRFSLGGAVSLPLPPMGHIRYIVPPTGVPTTGVCVGSYRICLTAGSVAGNGASAITACSGSFTPVSQSVTPSATKTPSTTRSASSTASRLIPTSSPTASRTGTPSTSGTPTSSRTRTPSNTPTPSSSRSNTGSPTSSSSKTIPPTVKLSVTSTTSASGTPTTSISRSSTSSATNTRTPTTTITATSSRTSAKSATSTPSVTPTSTRTPSASATPSSTLSNSRTPSAAPQIIFNPTTPGVDGTCPSGWTHGGVGSLRCYKYMTTGLTWFQARSHCESMPGSHAGLGKITQLSEFNAMRSLLQTNFVWIGLFDSSYAQNYASTSMCTGGSVDSRRACSHWQWASAPGQPPTSTSYILSAEGRSLWGRLEPNNYNAYVKNHRDYAGEHHVGFYGTYAPAAGSTSGRALNDWNPYNSFPYICEILRTDKYAGDFVSWSATAAGPLMRNLTLIEDATLAAAAGRAPTSISLPVPEPRTLSGAYGPNLEYLPCTLPPSRFSFFVTDSLGRSSFSPDSFGISRPPFNANSHSSSMATAFARLFSNDTITITWSEGTDVHVPAIITRPEFAHLQLFLKCASVPTLPMIDMGSVATSDRSATLTLLPIVGCTGGAHVIVSTFKGCHTAYSPAGTWGSASAPIVILPRPATLTFWSPACPSTAWAPGSPFAVSFSLLNGAARETVSVSVGTLALATAVTLDANGVGRFDLSAAYPTLSAWTAVSALTSIPLKIVSTSGAMAISCPITITRPSLAINVTSLAADATAFSDAPLSIKFTGTVGSACGTRLMLLRSGATVATYPPTSAAGLPPSITGFSWAIGASAYGLTSDPAWTVAAVRDTTSTFATAACKNEGPATATSSAFRLSAAITITAPVGGVLLWPEAGRCLFTTWTARAAIGSSTKVALTATGNGLAPRVVVTGVPADALSLTWCPTLDDVKALSVPLDPWTLVTLSLSTSSVTNVTLFIAQALPLPLPAPNTIGTPRVALTRVAPTITVLKPTALDTLFIGRAFPVEVRIAVPLPIVTPVPSPRPSPSRTPQTLSFGVSVVVSSTPDIDEALSAFLPTSSLTNVSSPFSHSLAYEIANPPLPIWATLPASFASLALLNVDIDLVSTLPLLPAPLRLLSRASLYAPVSGRITNDLASGSATTLTVIITNASLSSCAITSPAFRLSASVRSGVIPLLSTPAASTAVSDLVGIAPSMPTDIILTAPAPPTGAPGILFSESTYTFTWTPSFTACTSPLLDVVMFRSNVPPRDGVTTGWGPNAAAEVLVSKVPSSRGSVAWNFTSTDRTWWPACDANHYYLALVEPGASRRVYSFTGPFRLSRSTLSVSFASVPGTPSTLSNIFFGEPIAITIQATGFAGRQSSFQLFLQSEVAPFSLPFFKQTRRLPTARVLNTTTMVPSFGPNTVRSPLQQWSMTFLLNQAETMAQLTLPAGTVRVAELVSGVTSSTEAITAYKCAADDALNAYYAYLASGSAGNTPPSEASILLPPNGALSLSIDNIEMPIVRINASTPISTTGAVAGDVIALTLSITHTWLADFTVYSGVSLVRDGSSITLPLTGDCSATFANLANPRTATTNALSCTITLPIASTLISSFTSLGGGFRLRATERASGSSGVTPTFTLTAATLKIATPPPTSILEGGSKFGPLTFCLDRGASAISSASALTFSVALALPTGGATFVLANSVASSATSLPAGCTGVAWTMPIIDVPSALPSAFISAPTFSLTIFAATASGASLVRPLFDPNYSFTDGVGVILWNLDPLGTTYSVKDLVQGRRVVSAAVSLPVGLRDRLASANALMTIQVRCPGFAKAGWGFVDPWWFAWNSFANLGFGARATWASKYLTWSGRWSPWFYRSLVPDYNCRTQNAGCRSWMTPTQQSQVQALFTDPDSIKSENVIASVATIQWGGVWAATGGAGRVVQTVALNISSKWDSISFTDGACYLQTKTNSSQFVAMPSAASGVGLCSAPGICSQFIEGVWGKSNDLFFKPMFSMAASVKSFPVRVTLPSKNLGGRYLVSGDVAQTSIDLTKVSSGSNAVAAPRAIDIELRADGFRGNAKVGRTPSTINLCPPSLGGGCAQLINVAVTPLITRWADQGAPDGPTYANWGEANRENTQYSLRVRDHQWRTSWLYSDSNTFAFCEWPDIDSVRMRRLFEYMGLSGNGWLEGYTEAYDPTRPFVNWAPLAALGDSRTVQLRAFILNDFMRVRAFGIKCMNAVKFSLASYDAVAGVATPLQDLQCVSSYWNRGGPTIAVDPYSATINCDFRLTNAACSARVGSALVIMAVGSDGRGQELSQYFTYNRKDCPAPPALPTPSITQSQTPSTSTPPTASSSSTVSAAATPSGSPTATGTGSGTQTGSPTPSSTSTSSNTPTTTLTRTASTSVTPTASHSLALSDTSTPSNSGTSSTTSTLSLSVTSTGSSTPTPTSTGSGTPSTTTTLTATHSDTPSVSTTVGVSASPTGSDSGSISSSSTVTGSASPSGTPTSSSTGTSSDTQSTSDSPSNTITPSASVTSTPTSSSTQTPSPSGSDTSSTTASATSSGTPTNSMTPTASNTPSNSGTPTPSISRSASASNTPSGTDTPSPSVSLSGTPSASQTATPTQTNSPTGSDTPAVTPSGTDTPSASATSSTSVSSTITPTGTGSDSSSNSPSSSATPTTSPSPTGTGSDMPSSTGTGTSTALASESSTPSVSSSPSTSSSSSGTPSASQSSTPSLTPSGSTTVSTSPSPSSSSLIPGDFCLSASAPLTTAVWTAGQPISSILWSACSLMRGTPIAVALWQETYDKLGHVTYTHVLDFGLFTAEAGSAVDSVTGAPLSLPLTLGSLIPDSGTYGSGFYVELTPVQWPARVTRSPAGTFSILDVPTPPLSWLVTDPSFGSSWAPDTSASVSWTVSSRTTLLSQTGDANALGSIVLGTCSTSPGGTSSNFTAMSVLAVGVSMSDTSSMIVNVPDWVTSRSDYCVNLILTTTTTLNALSLPFTLTAPTKTPGSISVTSPRAGNVCVLGQGTCGLSWAAAGVSPNVEIALVQSISGVSMPVALTTVFATAVGSSLGIYSFTLPSDATSFAPANISAPFQFLVSDASDKSVSGLSPDFFITYQAPAPPSLVLILPSSLTEWSVDNNSTAVYAVNWTSQIPATLDPLSQQATLLLEYRATSSAIPSTFLAPISWSTVVLMAGAPLSTGFASVTLPSSVPVNAQGVSAGTIDYLYRVRIVSDADSSIFSLGDTFSIWAQPSSPAAGGGGASVPVAPIVPSESSSPSALASPSPSSSSVIAVIVPADPSPTPISGNTLSLSLNVNEPASGSIITMMSTTAITYSLAANDMNALASWSVALYRTLASGDIQWVYDANPMTSGAPPPSSWDWSLDPSAMPSDILYTSGYIVRLTVYTNLNTSVSSDSGDFTIAPFLMLIALTPENPIDVPEGDDLSISWAVVGIEGDVSLTVVNAQGDALTPALAARYPVTYDPALASGVTEFILKVSSTWGTFVPLAVLVTSLTRPDYSSTTSTFRVISLPKVISVTSLTTSAAALSYGASQTAIVTWTSSGNVGTAGAIDLVCIDSVTGDENLVDTALIASLSAATYTWTFAAVEPVGYVSASLCSLRVRSISAPLTAATSVGFSLVPSSLPSISLLLPAPASSGTALVTVPGASLPLKWFPKLCSGALSVRLLPTTGGATVDLTSAASTDVSSLSLLNFVLPLSIPANSYQLELSVASSSSASTILTTTPFDIVIGPIVFAFTSPAPGLVIVAGTMLTAAFLNPNSQWCGAYNVVVELFVQGAVAGDPVSLGLLTTVNGVSSCSGSVSLLLPSATLSGDYYLVATSAKNLIPALSATSPAFRVAPAPALQYINVDCPIGNSVIAGAASSIYFNASGFSTASSFNISLIQCAAGATLVGASSFTSNASVLSRLSTSDCRVVASISDNVQAISIYTWAIPTLLNDAAWNSALTSFISIVWAADSSMVVQGVSCPFHIHPAPATAITSVTTSIVGGVLDAGTTNNVYIAWTRLGPNTLYSLELWQERFFYNGGDVKIADLTPSSSPVLALDGAYAFVWTDVPTNLPSVEPVYIRVVAAPGAYAGSWGRSDEFMLRSAPLPGLPALLSTYCPNLGSSAPDYAAAQSTWSALCASNCAACTAANGVWAPGANVELTFSTPQVSRTGSTAGQVELSRLDNTLGAFTQTASICLPAATVAAGSTATLTYAPLEVNLGQLSGMNATLAALAPRNASVAAWPALFASLQVVSTQLAATCSDILPLIQVSVSVTSDASSTSSVVNDVTSSISSITSLPPSSFTITEDTEAAAADAAAATQAIIDAAAAEEARAAINETSGGGRRRRLSATSGTVARLLAQGGELESHPNAGTRLLAAHATDARLRRVNTRVLSKGKEALLLAGAGLNNDGDDSSARRLGGNTPTISSFVNYNAAAVVGPAAVPRGVSPLSMHFTRETPSVGRVLANSAYRVLTGTTASSAAAAAAPVKVFLRVSAVASSPAAASALRAMIESHASGLSPSSANPRSLASRSLAGTTTTTILSTTIIPAASLTTLNSSVGVAAAGSTTTVLAEVRPYAGVGNATLTASAYDDARANELRASNKDSQDSAFSLLRQYISAFAASAYSYALAVLTDPRFYGFLAFLALFIYVIGELVDTRARAKWLGRVATGGIHVTGSTYTPSVAKKVGVDMAQLVSAIPSQIPSAGLEHTGRGDTLSYVHAYATVRASLYSLLYKGEPPVTKLGPLDRTSISAYAQNDDGMTNVNVNPLNHAAVAKILSSSPHTSHLGGKQIFQAPASTRWALNAVLTRQHKDDDRTSNPSTTNSGGPVGRAVKVSSSQHFSVSQTINPTF